MWYSKLGNKAGIWQKWPILECNVPTHPQHLFQTLIVSILLVSSSFLSCRTFIVRPRYPVIRLNAATWLLGQAVAERGRGRLLFWFPMTGLWRKTVGLPIKLQQHNKSVCYAVYTLFAGVWEDYMETEWRCICSIHVIWERNHQDWNTSSVFRFIWSPKEDITEVSCSMWKILPQWSSTENIP